MVNPDRNLSPSQLRLLCSWVLVVGTVWLAVLWNVGLNNPDIARGIKRSGIVATLDMPLHTSGEHFLSLTRTLNRYSPQFRPSQLKPSQLKPTQYTPNETLDTFVVFLFKAAILLQLAAVLFCAARLVVLPFDFLQLLTLNISRAPPAI